MSAEGEQLDVSVLQLVVKIIAVFRFTPASWWSVSG